MNLPAYSHKVFLDFQNSFNPENKKVLEVGGHLPSELVRKARVKHWYSISLDCPFQTEASDYTAKNMDCRKLDLPSEEFDLIYSCTAFEHINNLNVALSEMYRVLKPQGILFSAFGPIWSSYCGHHLEFVYNKQKVDFNQQVLPNWAHLLWTRDEVRSYLQEKIMDHNLVTVLIDRIYNSDYINRLFYEDYLKIFLDSDFHIYQLGSFAGRFDILPKATRIKLAAMYPNNKDFSSYGLRVVLLKI